MIAAQGKKRLLWNEISEKLREKGHNYSGLVCDRKWRLLKANYLKRREKYKKLGMGSVVKWQYYYDIDRLLGVPAGISKLSNKYYIDYSYSRFVKIINFSL